MNQEQFHHQLARQGITLSPAQLDQFEQYYRLLADWNQKMNLTALTEREEVYLKHFYDSLTVAFYYNFREPVNLVDVGAGAGFPSLPLKICFPHVQVTIVDSLKKRITFLEHLVQALNLDHVRLYHDRAEHFGQLPEHREQYDLVLARAVARLNVLSELCLPLAKVKGTFIAMKGAKGKEELQEAQGAIPKLGGEIKDLHQLYLPGDEGERQLIILHKVRPTPGKYPRQPGLPAKKPLK
ncbi:Ribosomal RNA small subunit methyltransferase G [Caldalkalibacillus thermarum TA2.A1]|uniref:Ribosomal RNA small subunit methyltransferase G n=1 Tax=Caldalkalibacillus thermarum (strain TA2.A1) TaxID=986075 RepID=F5L4S8_CALTT|nr:16S rRNA (guanine(527)-N(7))-methyltransferase RsmG [Caldalkalibacillus thermarum]EGL83645.1 Ribosomal RNA small subunit methyltransferase G [Caldalkalibacillus thermarum TA2.A1]QZT34289.1 16S rRNA (guanine(527)-N(7))-methyltransferase RsmG [Caldalkalibacillus thermarum TA2.A1]